MARRTIDQHPPGWGLLYLLSVGFNSGGGSPHGYLSSTLVASLYVGSYRCTKLPATAGEITIPVPDSKVYSTDVGRQRPASNLIDNASSKATFYYRAQRARLLSAGRAH